MPAVEEPQFGWNDAGFGSRQSRVQVSPLLWVSSMALGRGTPLHSNQEPAGATKLSCGVSDGGGFLRGRFACGLG